MDKIFAVVLSYKRRELLERCLAAIAAQTMPPDGIIVVDNASGPEVEAMLREQQLPGLEVHVLERNIGASGGFSAGFRLAYARGADFVWMMDDDVVPEPDALQQLIAADQRLASLNEPRSFLISAAYTETDLLTNVPGIDERPNDIDYPDWPRLVEHGVVPVERATYVSILVPRATLARHGLPIASMFMWGDDTEFTLRMSREAPGFLVPASKVRHLRKIPGSIDILREADPARQRLHRYFIRNEVFIFRKFHGKRRLLRLILARLLLAGRLLGRREYFKSLVVLRGLLESVGYMPRAEPASSPMQALGVGVRLLRPNVTARPVAPVQALNGATAQARGTHVGISSG